MSKLKRIAIIGGETHIGEVEDLAGKRLEIVGYAVREDQVEGLRKKYSGPVLTDFRKLLDVTKPEIVSVANENDLKAGVCLEALGRGMHLIVDKPLAITLEDTRAIRSAAERAGKSVLMLLTLRGHPQYRKVREIVRSGLIGAPVQLYQKMSVELKWGKRPSWFFDRRRSGGPILDLAIHGVDQFEWVTGLRLVDVTAQEANLSRPELPHLTDSGAIFFRLNNGGTALMEQNRLMPDGQGQDYRLRVVGAKGQIDMRMGEYLRVQTASGLTQYEMKDLGPALSVVEKWLDSLDGARENPAPDQDSFRANEICCLAVSAAREKRTLSLV